MIYVLTTSNTKDTGVRQLGRLQHNSQGTSAFHTVHPVGLHKLLVFFVNTEGVPSKLLDVFIKISAEILIKDCEQ